MGREPLIAGAIRAIKATNSGSAKTQYNHAREATRFVNELRSLGYGVQNWKNLSNKHVQAVVNSWQSRGLAVSTIKENLSGVRAVCDYYKNDAIAADNAAFGIANRVYITNADKSLSQEAYENALAALKNGDTDQARVAVQLEMQRELGLRKEEAFKFDPSNHVLADGRVVISAGTKGGRERVLSEISAKGREAIEHARAIAGRSGNTMPSDKTERQWERYYYRQIRGVGLSKADSGASSHGLRHAYAQARYREMTGFEAPCRFKSREEYRLNAQEVAGQAWRKLDHDARLRLMGELGHGSDRNDVISQYIGSA